MHWQPDILAHHEAAHIALPPDTDGEGEIQATLVRYTPGCAHSTAVLYIHGMSDYFFHSHLSAVFDTEDIATYGIDLRRCGRSRSEHQTWHYTSNMDCYFEELTAALEYLSTQHTTVIPIAHSTGGLIAARWLSWLAIHHPELHAQVAGLVLNSPWLDMVGRKEFIAVARPVLYRIAAKQPKRVIAAAKNPSYGKSLHCEHDGNWEYSLDFKPLCGHPKHAGWLRAVDTAQREIQRGKIDCQVPVLCLCSTSSAGPKAKLEQLQRTDAVLDVRRIRQCVPLIAQRVTVQLIADAAHDVYLSIPTARQAAIAHTTAFIKALQ